MKPFSPLPPAERYHEATKHSWISVRRGAHGLDWSTQPSVFKRYPDDLPRIPFDPEDPVKAFLRHIVAITAKKSYPGAEVYLRATPSAGALYPNELYFQCRSITGFRDGIYHYEVASASAVLLAEIDRGVGLEAYLEEGRIRRGFLFFVSGVYWRSSWKYRDRAFRYVLLDGGHLLGGVEAAAGLQNEEYRVRYRIDREGLNTFFGFGREEWVLSAVELASRGEEKVTAPKIRLESTNPTGTFRPSEVIERAYRETSSVQGCREERRQPGLPFSFPLWERAIWHRRSIRAFGGEPISREAWERILHYAVAPEPSDCDEELKLYCVVNRVAGMEPGLWLGEKLLRPGDFADRAGYLCLEQALGRESAVTLFMTSGGRNYQALYQKAGLVGHRLYLAAQAQGIGASGIGAYYDDKVREFLGTEEKILYAFAVGR